MGAPVSKTGGPRFESWLPRSWSSIAYVLFFLAGLAFGYAAAGRRVAAVRVPDPAGAAAPCQEGVDGTMLLRLLVALVVTAVGVVLGMLLDPGGARLAAPGGR